MGVEVEGCEGGWVNEYWVLGIGSVEPKSLGLGTQTPNPNT